MKRLLSIIGAISLIGTSTTSLVACNTQQYTEKELADLKEKNNITTKNGILEWIAPQEKTFNQVDNKYYYVVWRGDKNNKWKLNKFKNDIEINKDKLIEKNDYILNLSWAVDSLDLTIYAPKSFRTWYWRLDNKERFKSVYRWNGEEQKLPNLDIDDKGNIKVNE